MTMSPGPNDGEGEVSCPHGAGTSASPPTKGCQGWGAVLIGVDDQDRTAARATR